MFLKWPNIRQFLGFTSICILAGLLYLYFPANSDIADQQLSQETTSFNSAKPSSKVGGFTSLTSEYQFPNLQVEGKIPKWLIGKLFLTGPAQFELGRTTIKYWYNALAMIHSFSFGKQVSYQNRFIRGDFYKHCKKKGKFDSSLTETTKKPSLFSKLSNAFGEQEPYDNGNLGFWQIGSKLCAMTETPLPVMINPHTLETNGTLKFNDALTGHITTAHPLYDQDTHTWYNLMIELGNSSIYYIYSMNERSYTRKVLCKIPTKNPSYMRCFAMTQNYLILIEQPYIINPMDLLMGSGFLDAVQWKPKKGTNFIIINKKTGALVNTIKAPSFFVMDIVHAKENGKRIDVDCVTYANPKILTKTTMRFLRGNNKPDNEPTQFNRYSINIQNSQVTSQPLTSTPCEMPVINPARTNKSYTFAFGLSSENQLDFPHQLVKVNVVDGSCLLWADNDSYPSRPTFIPNPHGKDEDDGIIISVVYTSSRHTSSLVMLNAKTMKQIARIKLPHHIPLGLSGIYYAKDALQALS